jgi:hypothetical protein
MRIVSRTLAVALGAGLTLSGALSLAPVQAQCEGSNCTAGCTQCDGAGGSGAAHLGCCGTAGCAGGCGLVHGGGAAALGAGHMVAGHVAAGAHNVVSHVAGHLRGHCADGSCGHLGGHFGGRLGGYGAGMAGPPAHPLFHNYYTQGAADQANASLYLAPRSQIPGNVGHTYYTYQPLYPHQFLHTHTDRYGHAYPGGYNSTKAHYYNPPVRTAIGLLHNNFRIPR